MRASRVDALIAGAGPAGAAMAITLRQRGWSVRLVEKKGQGRPRLGETLPPAARLVLHRLGLWERFLQKNHPPCYGNRSAWGAAREEARDFLQNPYGAGVFLDRAAFEGMLREEAIRAGASLTDNVVIRSVTHAPGSGWALSLSRGDKIEVVEASYLIDATGRAAGLARKLGLRRQSSAPMLAIFCVMQAAPGAPLPPWETLVESAEIGWWYAAPQPGGQGVVALMTDGDLARSARVLQLSGFLAMLKETSLLKGWVSEHRLCPCGPPYGVSAETGITERIAGDDWLVVGDAACTLDPLSSRGILAALASALHAGHSLAAARAGDARALLRYASAIEEVYTQHRTQQRRYYLLEQRWQSAAFWRRRH